MSIVVDYTKRIDPTALKSAGVIGVCRYLSLPQPNTDWKRIGQAEYDELKRTGFKVTLNFEYAADDWLGGATAGRSHGTVAVVEAGKLGYPKGSVIVGSADFDMSASQWLASGKAYATAYRDTVRSGGYRPGVYGPWDVLGWCKSLGYDAFWQAGMSTDWSFGRNAKPWPGAHLIQRGHTTIGGVDTDWSEIKITPLWKGNDVSDLRIAAVKDNNATPPLTTWYVGNGLFYRAILTWPEHEYLIAGGAVEKSFASTDDWSAYTGRTDVAKLSTVNLTLTDEQISNALHAHIDHLAMALATHFKVV